MWGAGYVWSATLNEGVVMGLRRKRFILDAGFQWRFVICFIAVALMGSVAATLSFNIVAMEVLEELQWSVHLKAPSTADVLRPLFLYINLFNVIFVLTLLTITGVWMLRRLKGPIYRITQNLKMIAAGNLSSAIVLRQRDEFKDVAEALNEMLNRTRERCTRCREKYKEISQALSELEMAYAREEPVKEAGERIIQSIQTMRNDLSQ